MERLFHYLARKLTRRTTCRSQPNINDLWHLTKDINILRLNCKNMGYQIARELQPQLLEISYPDEPRKHFVASKPCTQTDVESTWFAYWCRQLNATPMYHRKLWEYAFLLQVMYDRDLLNSGARGIGFGCGQEPIASYCASKGMKVLVSDLTPDQAAGKGWQETRQHATARDNAFYEDIVDRDSFDLNVTHQFIDMNHIPPLDPSYDFCWSICSMEHLGSIENGLAFVEKSLSVLKPGGVAIHTTEFNYLSEDETIDNWSTVLFRKKDILQLAERLAKSGHLLVNPEFNTGDRLLDRYIDVPPYALGEGGLEPEQWGNSHQIAPRERAFDQIAHLKLAVDGFASTCYGLVVIKDPSGGER